MASLGLRLGGQVASRLVSRSGAATNFVTRRHFSEMPLTFATPNRFGRDVQYFAEMMARREKSVFLALLTCNPMAPFSFLYLGLPPTNLSWRPLFPSQHVLQRKHGEAD